MGIANAERTLTYLRILTEFVSQDQYRDVVGMYVYSRGASLQGSRFTHTRIVWASSTKSCGQLSDKLLCRVSITRHTKPSEPQRAGFHSLCLQSAVLFNLIRQWHWFRSWTLYRNP